MRIRRCRFCAALQLLGCIVAALAPLCTASASSDAERKLLMQRIAANWVASQAPDGALPYGFDFMADKPLRPEGRPWAAIVRQAGSFYMLAEYYAYSKDPSLEGPLRRALRGLEQHSLPIGARPLQKAVHATGLLQVPFGRWKLNALLGRLGLLYSDRGAGKVISPDGRYSTAETGAGALAMLTELTYARASGDATFAGLREAWLEGLLTLHVPRGGFRASPASIDEGDYPDGEGWFALAVYSDALPGDRRVSAVLAELDRQMIERHGEKPTTRFWHWGQLAAARRYAATGDARFLRFLTQQAQVFFARFDSADAADDNRCSEMEGMAATLTALSRSGEEHRELAERIRTWLTTESAKLPRLQIQEGQTRLALGGDAFMSAPRMTAFSGAFLMGLYRPETRVDAAAHCLSAMLFLERLGSPP